MQEYELAGIETIARGVAIIDGEVLICRAKGGKSSYLPGGHIEFGESAREALVREIREELGVEAETGRFLGAVENSFMQHGRPHAEINLIFELKFSGKPDAVAKEDWIEFEWVRLDDLKNANLLPPVFNALSSDPDVFFAP
jgi:8-oxo-dGTP pyrophosphatase MutT (NUDIX family)